MGEEFPLWQCNGDGCIVFSIGSARRTYAYLCSKRIVGSRLVNKPRIARSYPPSSSFPTKTGRAQGQERGLSMGGEDGVILAESWRGSVSGLAQRRKANIWSMGLKCDWQGTENKRNA